MTGAIKPYIPREERMHTLTHKLKKYNNRVPGEPVNSVEAMKNWRQNQKRRYTDVVLSRLDMKGLEREEAHYLVQIFNFKHLCGRCTLEQIITAICLYVKFSHTRKRSLSNFDICKENRVTEPLYIGIISNMAWAFISLSQEKTPLTVENLKYEPPENQRRIYTDAVLWRLDMEGEKRDQAHYLVQTFDFNLLSTDFSLLQGIMGICLFVKFYNGQKRPVSGVRICNEVNLTESLYMGIVTMIASQFQGLLHIHKNF